MFHRLGYVVLCRLKPERAEVEHDKRQVFFSSLSSQQLSYLLGTDAGGTGLHQERAKEPKRDSFPHTVGLVCL